MESKAPDIPKEMLAEFKDYLKTFLKVDKRSFSIPFSVSATYTKSRKELGLLGWQRELFKELQNSVAEEMYSGEEVLSYLVKMDRQMVRPVGRVVVVPEYGYKYRLVTAVNEPLIVTTGTIANSIRKSVTRLPGCKYLFEDDRATSIQIASAVNGKRHRFSYRSTDWTASTDYISHDFTLAFGEAIDELLADKGLNVLSGMCSRALGPFEISLPDGSSFETTRGVLMGTPLSFIMLCCYHSFILFRVMGNQYRSLRFIKGDDAAFPDVQGSSARYTALVESLGQVLSRGKDFQSSKGIVFAEQLVYVAGPQAGIIQYPAMKRLNIRDREAVFSLDEQMSWSLDVAKRVGRAIACTKHKKRGLFDHFPMEMSGRGIPPRHGIAKWWYRMSSKIRDRITLVLSDPDGKRLLSFFRSIPMDVKGLSFPFSKYVDEASMYTGPDIDIVPLAAELAKGALMHRMYTPDLTAKSFKRFDPDGFKRVWNLAIVLDKRGSQLFANRSRDEIPFLRDLGLIPMERDSDLLRGFGIAIKL
jgi:hypothetical protein